MASWTMSLGFMVSFRLLEMLFIGARRPGNKKKEEVSECEQGEKNGWSQRKKRRSKLKRKDREKKKNNKHCQGNQNII